MPPNLGGFFMVRSYYPSECHADYFDFERIEALKPAIEACGISTLSQSPMLGFHKQMDNRIKLLEEILSFRMQGVEFDNGDMYVDGHKAASDVRDEFVSVMLTMTNLSTECLIQLTKLGYDATPFNQILKQNAKREMRLRLGKVTVADVLAAQPATTNLLKFMRASIKMIGVSNLQSFIASMTQKLTLSDISDESKRSEERRVGKECRTGRAQE